MIKAACRFFFSHGAALRDSVQAWANSPRCRNLTDVAVQSEVIISNSNKWMTLQFRGRFSERRKKQRVSGQVPRLPLIVFLNQGRGKKPFPLHTAEAQGWVSK